MSFTSPLAPYRRLLRLTGPLYLLVAFLGRLPLAMSQLGTLLLVSSVTGSYGAGGASAGALAVANAIGSPIAGGLTDRLGQRTVVAVQSLLASVGLITLVLLAQGHQAGEPWWHLALAAAVAGVFAPQIGPLARVRWRPIADARGDRDRATLDAAFSYEGAADEASFVLGPALIGGMIAVLDPAAALIVAAAVLAFFGTAFALHPTAVLTHRGTHAVVAVGARMLTGAVVLLAAVQFSIGIVFGSVQTGTSVLATLAGEPGLTGLFHALLGVGSVVAGLAVVTLPPAFAYPSRLRVFCSTMALLALPLLWVDSLAALAPALLLLGVAVAPSMITTFTIAERVTNIRRVGAVMTLLAATTGLGYAAGSSVAGRLADWGGHTPAYAVTVAGASLAALLAVAGHRLLTRARAQTPQPETSLT